MCSSGHGRRLDNAQGWCNRMITLTRLSGSAFALNSDLIERIDATPDTVVTLVDGTKYVVAETLDEVVAAVRRHRGEVIALSAYLEAEAWRPPTRRPPRLRHRERLARRRAGARSRGRSPDGSGNPDRRRLVALVIIVVANMLEGGNPMALLLLPPMLLVFGATLLGLPGRRHDGRRQEAPSAALKRAFTGSAQPAGRPGARRSSRSPRRPAARACSPWRTRSRTIDDPFLVTGAHAGHRRHRPRGAARDPRGRDRRQEARGQAGREVLRRRRRLRADHRHHRHRHGPGARAGEPRRARGARPPDRRRVRRHPVGRAVRQRASCCRSRPGSSASASSRPPRWSSSSRASPRSRPASNPRVVAQKLRLAAARRAARAEAA